MGRCAHPRRAVAGRRATATGIVGDPWLRDMNESLFTPTGLRKLTSDLELQRAKLEALHHGFPAIAEGASVVDRPTEGLDSNELARLEQQIAVLEDRLAAAVVVHPEPGDDEVDLGELACVRDLDTGERFEYRIVGAGEANPEAGSISYASPVGAALLGRRVGDVIHVDVPSGRLRLEVVEVADELGARSATIAGGEDGLKTPWPVGQSSATLVVS